MSIECYALVEFKAPLTQEEKFWEEVNEIGDGVPTKQDITYILCHLRLIQPSGKNGSVPLPKWEVVEHLQGYDSYLQAGDVEGLRDLCIERGFKLLNSKSIYCSVISDMRVQKWQIVQLYPECKSMPMWLAVDYIRNKM